MSNSMGRRPSLKNPQVQEELRNLVPQEVFRGSYSEYNLTNMTRLSGNSMRGSLPKRNGSGVPTPSLRRIAAHNSTVTMNMTTLGVGMGSQSRTKTRSTASNSASRPPRSASVPRSVTVSNKNPPQRTQIGRVAKTISSLNTTTTRRKSKSHESLSVLQTPAFTPLTRSRSKSPGGLSTTRRRGVHNDISDAGKSISITKERKVLAEMARYVHEFLVHHDCQARPAEWKDLVNPVRVPVAKYMGMVKFLASHFVGDAYFSKTDKLDDDAEKIIELFKILKYPGTLPKSHLKTPTVQHAWPGCFTFLAWLCCRTQAMFHPPSEQSNICELVNNGLQEFVFESFLTLFPLHFRNELAPDHIDIEMENFRLRVRESYATDLSKTKEELIEERAEKQAELEALNNEVDPSKEVKERLSAEGEVLTSLLTKIRDAENLCKKYSNCNHLKLQNERIQLEIDAKQAELSRIRHQINGQPLSKQEASAMQNETAALKNQLETIRHVNANLGNESQTRLKRLEVCQKQFYDFCKKFDIVESYNENLRFLKLDEYSILPNPFAPIELEEWMKTVAKTLRRSQSRVNEMANEVMLSSQAKDKENQEFITKMDQIMKEIEEFKMKLQTVQKYKEFHAREHEQKQSAMQHQLNEICSALRFEEENLNGVRLEKESAVEQLNSWRNSLEAEKLRAKEWNDKVEEAFSSYMLFDAKLKTFLHQMVTTAAEGQQKFYQTHFGINIFEDIDFASTENKENNNN